MRRCRQRTPFACIVPYGIVSTCWDSVLGFPYLGTVPAPLAMPRLATPRPLVQASSVSIAGPLLYTLTAPRISDGTAMGALQIPPDGQPIFLMADRQTTGRYPVVAVVLAADWHVAGQLLPGDPVRFSLTSMEEAKSAIEAQWRAWDQALPPDEER